MKKEITLSINPTYLCNFRCDFCYLTREQLSDKKRAPLDEIEERLKEVSEDYVITHVDLYGGEITLLPHTYLYDLKRIIKKYYKGRINVITNLWQLDKFLLEDDIDVSVSYDFSAREKHKEVLRNLISFPKPVSVLILASKQLMDEKITKIIRTPSSVKSVVSVEIKPYSSNQSNDLGILDKDFEDYIIKWIKEFRDIEPNFEFQNIYNIQDSLLGVYNAYSSDHLYISPDGKFSVLEFDANQKELFMELESIKEYQEWTKKERDAVGNNEFCKQCRFIGTCLTEHYREVINPDNGCNGYKNLLEWYEAVP